MARQPRRKSATPGTTGNDVGIARRGRKAAWLRRQQSAQPTVLVAYAVPAGREATIADQIASGNLPRVEALIRESAAG